MQDLKKALISLINESKRVVSVNNLKDWNFQSAIEVAEHQINQPVSASYSEASLIGFGNYLLQRYGVKEHSTDGANTPLFQRQVHDADVCNWHDENPMKPPKLPSEFQNGDKAVFIWKINRSHPQDDGFDTFPGVPCKILSVHFHGEKVKYDIELFFAEGKKSRIYNVDESLITPVE